MSAEREPAGRTASGAPAGLCVLGTGASSGKTMVVRAICRLATDNGIAVVPYKAVSVVDRPVSVAGRIIDESLQLLGLAARLHGEQIAASCSFAATTTDGAKYSVQGSAGVEVESVPLLCQDHLDWSVLPEDVYEMLSQQVRSDIEGTRATHTIVIEGSASPTDSLGRDLANADAWRVARVPIVLVGAALQGGCAASIVGTYTLLPADVRNAVVGFVVNGITEPRVGDAWAAKISAETGLECMATIPKLPAYTYLRERAVREERDVENETTRLASQLGDLWPAFKAFVTVIDSGDTARLA